MKYRPSVSVWLAVLFFVVARTVLHATTLPAGFTETRLPYDLMFPSSMAIAPDGRVFIGERSGPVRIFKNDQLLPAPFVTLAVDSSGERGVLGIAFDPNFAVNQYVYVYHTATTPAIHNRVSRFTANGDVAVPGSEVILLELDDLVSNQHNSGSMRFGKDGKLYIASGDNYYSPNAQSLQNLKGKILRINPDGTIPADNPFYTSTTGNNRAIWALGLRNPYTFDIQPGTGRMFINDVGHVTWEEINEGAAGSNYGWPESEGPTTDPRFHAPLFAYGHGNGDQLGCAITGGGFYNPPQPQFPSQYLGKYFFIDYCNGWIRTLDLASNAASTFASGIPVWNTIQICFSPDGALYYLTTADNRGIGALFKINYTGSLAAQVGTQPEGETVTVNDTATFTISAYGGQPLIYQWQKNGTDIAGANAPSYTTPSTTLADDGAGYRCTVTNSYGTAASNTAVLRVTTNRAPMPAITVPANGAFFNAGDTISFSGGASDFEDGTLPPSALTWEVHLHHNIHLHPFVDPIIGISNGSFTIPATGEVSTNIFYRIYLTAVDSQGMSNSTYVDLFPRLSQINLQTSPTGLQLTLDGLPMTSPTSDLSVINMTRTLGVTTPQTKNGITYDFVNWSDSGAATHDIATPASVTTYTANFRARANGNISASPNPITVTDGSGLGVTTLAWTSQSTTDVQVRVGSPSGSLFAMSPAGSFSSTTGKWVANGTVFYLQNVSGGLPLTSANTLATVTVNLITRTGSINANPNPIVVTDGTGRGVTTLSWTTAGTSTVEVRVGSPTGALFARSAAGTRSSTTGKWVADGTVFYLQDVSGGLPLTSANTLKTVRVGVVTRTGSISANPNPIVVTDGTGLGVTTLSWTSAGTKTVEVRVGSPSGSLFSRSGPGSKSATTGKWVSNGTVFYLQDVSNNLPLTSANTLATTRVNVTSGTP